MSSKMREALEEIREMSDSWFWGVTVTKSSEDLLMECGKIAELALAEPVRNCDLYATPKEAGEAFISESCENPCGNCTVSDECHNPLIHECGINWLFAEAKGE